MMNKFLIIALMMTTFYMEGCVSNNEDAVNYFDAVYLPVQEVVELDNQFQEELQSQLIAVDEVKNESDLIINDQDYEKSIEAINSAYTALRDYLEQELIKLKSIEVYNNETAYQRAGLALLTAYSDVAESDFAEMIKIISKEDLSKEDNDRFNQLLKQSNDKLNIELESFYDTAIDYGDRNEIDIEFDEE